jgi:uncharacterized membrane protein HdeD (DUF308 family)
MATQWRDQPAGAGIGGPWFERSMFGGWNRDAIRRSHRGLLAAGILAILAGVVAIAVPALASVTAAIFIGWLLVFAGVTMAIHAVSQRSLLRGLEALLSLIAGLYVVVFPLHGTVTLTFVLAVWFFATGVLSLTIAARWWGAPGAWMQAVGGVLSIVLGFLIAASLPSSAAWALGLLVGIDLIFWGMHALLGARLLKDVTTP